MKRWIAGAVFAVGLTVLGGAAVAQDAAPRDEGQRPDTQRERRSIPENTKAAGSAKGTSETISSPGEQGGAV
ncbi:MAG: hypothetical protein H0U91_12210 [Rubrobacter sp.]|jgi:hypothetical protein|nr:hypothetical protein [Rubrobacter sp.]